MKKTLFLFSVVLLVVGLAIPAAAQEKRFDGVTLRVFANSHDPMLKAIKWSIQAAKDQLGIDILMDEAAYGVQYEKATSAFASGAGQYDVIVAAHQWTGGWFEAGYLESLDPFIKADKTFDPGIYNPKAYSINSTVNGHQVGLPFNMEGRLMFYRKDIFKAEKLKVPTTEKEWLNTVMYFANNRSKMHGEVRPAISTVPATCTVLSRVPLIHSARTGESSTGRHTRPITVSGMTSTRTSWTRSS